jgi:hypothetical protein
VEEARSVTETRVSQFLPDWASVRVTTRRDGFVDLGG